MKLKLPKIFTNAFSKGDSLDYPIDESIGSAFTTPIMSGGVPPRLGTKELLRAYTNMPWLRAVTNKIGQSVGATTWKIMVKKDRKSGKAYKSRKLQNASFDVRQNLYNKEMLKDELVEIEDHPLLDLLIDGNPKLLGQGVFKVTQVHLDLVGEAFWIIERNAIGTPVAVWPTPPDWIKNFPTNEHPYYRIEVGTTRYDVPITEMIPFIDPDPANPYGRGTGVAKALADELETDEYISKHLKGFFHNRARPDIIISADGISKSDTKRMEEKWLEKHRGFWNSFKPHFFSRKVNITTLSQDLESMQMTELRKQEQDIVLQVFGVSPEKFGRLSASNRSTITAADYFWTKDTIAPRVEFMRNTLQKHLIPMFDDRIILDYESPVTQDHEHRLAVMRTAPSAFTINEWRQEAEKPSLGEDGEQFIMRPGEIPVDSAHDLEDSNNSEEETEEEDDDNKELDRILQEKAPEIKEKILQRIQNLKANTNDG